MEKHYLQFEDREENKFIYTDIFKDYVRDFRLHIVLGCLRQLKVASYQGPCTSWWPKKKEQLLPTTVSTRILGSSTYDSVHTWPPACPC